MKYLFLILASVLIVLSVVTYLSFPETGSEVPVIYWVTDRNPARDDQVRIFHEWLVKHGHTTDDGRPVVELRLDMANRDPTKQIIQSVSGVGGDIMDVFGGASMRLFQEMSIIADITEPAREHGFGLDATYPALEPELFVDGRQYMFPCNVTVNMMWVNVDTFAKYGLEAPPSRLSFDEFEALGRQFMEAANPEGTRASDRKFFANNLNPTVMHRSVGLSIFNETLTACDLNDPRYVEVLRRQYDWIYEDNILPTPDDRDAFATEEGYGGSTLALFGSGNYAMVTGGRYFLIKFRDFDNLGQLRVIEPPHGGYPNTAINTRGAVLYAGSENPELANLFHAYLASEAYNMQIVRDADALPPNPKFTQYEEFSRPPEHPNEWGAHDAFVEAAQNIAIGGVYSPFILASKVNNEVNFFREDFTAGRISAEEAAARTAQTINQRIVANLGRKVHLKPEYDRRIELQKKIDARLDAGQKVPAEWVLNPFYRRYYRDRGMLVEPEAPAGGASTAASVNEG